MKPQSESRLPLTTRLDVVATTLLIVVTLLVGTFAVWDRANPPSTPSAIHGQPTPPQPVPPAQPVSIDDAPILGDANARIALIVFSEFECPYCAKAAREVLPEIERQYVRTGKVFVAFRHFPLPFHKNARKASEAAECAGRQGRFWQFHDWAFQNQTQLFDANLVGAAKTLGLDLGEFRVCLTGQAMRRIDADITDGRSFEIVGTPTWFLGRIQPDGSVKVTERFDGSKPFIVFQAAIDRLIADENQVGG
jgi:protein-disulfide isomerase